MEATASLRSRLSSLMRRNRLIGERTTTILSTNFELFEYSNKEFKMSLRRRQRQRQRQRERLKNLNGLRLTKQQFYTCSTPFLVHFFAVTARLRRELPNFMFYNNNNNSNNNNNNNNNIYYLFCAFSIKYSKARPRPRVALRRISLSLFKLGYIS